MNCPACGAPMRLKPDQTTLKCDYCQSVVLPESNDEGISVLDEAPDYSCPLCNANLMKATLANGRIVYCTKCKGMAVPMETFEVLIEAVRGQHGTAPRSSKGDIEDLHRQINCPHCHHRMDAHFYAGPGNVVIDSCEDCALIWLDGGELVRIARAAED